MPLIDLRARISIDGLDQTRRGLDQVKRGFAEVKQQAELAIGDMERFGRALASVASAALSVGQRLAGMAAGFAALSAAASGALGIFAFNTAAKFDSLTRGLAAMAENADVLRGELIRLKDVAKLPGLGFEEAVQGSLALQSVGLSARESEGALRAFGNALALAGHGKAELTETLNQIQQGLSKGAFEQEDLRAIASRIPQVRAALQAAFGTNDLQQLNQLGAVTIVRGLVAELQKLPRISGSVANDIENLGDAIKNAIKPLGDGLIQAFSAAQPAIERFFGDVTFRLTQVGEVIAALGKSGVVGEILGKLLGAGESLFGPDFQKGVAFFAATLAAVTENVAQVIPSAFAYAAQLMNAVVLNIRVAFVAAGQITDAIVRAIKVVFDHLDTILDVLSLGTYHAIKADLGDILENLDIPPFVGLPAPPNFGNLLAGRDDIFGRIMGAVGPLSDLPSGLNFGKNPGLPGNTVGQAGALDDLLAKIEKNTRATADELSLRKQALGGGQLARLGITPAELARAGVSGSAPGKGDYGLPVAGTQIEKMLRQMIQQEMAKGGGQPRFR